MVTDGTVDSGEIAAILVTLRVNEEESLFVLVAADGSINRLGTGSVNNTDRDLFIGKTTVGICINE